MSSATSLARIPRPLRGFGTGRPFAATGSLRPTSSGGGTGVRADRSRADRATRTTLRRAVRRLWGITMTTLVLAAAAAFAFLAIGPHVFGYRTMTMTTTSMAPGIEPGDVVVSVPVKPADVRVGDVITYESPVGDQGSVTRRVVSVGHDSAGRVGIVTKGDADAAVDPWVATLASDTAWRTTHVVHHLGDLVSVVRAVAPQSWVLWSALGLATLAGLGGLGGRTGPGTGSITKERTDV